MPSVQKLDFVRGFKVANEDLTISHLQFANDAFIFYVQLKGSSKGSKLSYKSFELVSGLG